MNYQLSFRVELALLKQQKFSFLIEAMLRQWQHEQPKLALPLVLEEINELKVWLEHFNQSHVLANYASEEIDLNQRNEFNELLDVYLNPIIFNNNFIEQFDLLIFQEKQPSHLLLTGTETALPVDLANELVELKHWTKLIDIYNKYSLLYAVSQSLADIPYRALVVAGNNLIPELLFNDIYFSVDLLLLRVKEEKQTLIERGLYHLKKQVQIGSFTPPAVKQAIRELENWK